MTNTQLYCFGNSCVSDLQIMIKNDLPKKILLVTGVGSYKYSGAKAIFEKILKNISVIQFSDFQKNPRIEDVKKGIKLFKEHKCDYVIAVGGGSVIDMAKLINIGQANKGGLRKMFLNPNLINKSGKKLIAIPTTAGAGSEATHFAVVYIDKKKHSVAHPEFILPNVAIIIPEFTYSLNANQTAISGLDAFSQAIEGYWSINSTIEAKKYAKQSMKLILRALPVAVKSGEHKARISMSKAAYLAGKTINITKTTGPHAMSYVFTSQFGIPHGHAVALTLGDWFEFNSNVTSKDCLDNRGVDYVRNIFLKLNELLDSKNAKDSKTIIIRFVESLGLETKLSQLNIPKDKIEWISSEINIERLRNNPRQITQTELYQIIHNVY